MGGKTIGFTGHKHSEKSRLKMSLSHQGKSNWWLKGVFLSEGRKKQISKALKGRHLPTRTKEHALKIASALRGKHHTEPERKVRGLFAQGTIGNPVVGDIRYANELGYVCNKWIRYRYTKCLLCGIERWVEYRSNRISRYCQNCAGKLITAKLTVKWKNLDYKTMMLKKLRQTCAKVKPTKPERAVEEILMSLYPNEYIYTGNGSIVIANCIPDFVNVNGQKKVIEVFGNYWHSLGKVGRTRQEEECFRKQKYAKYGFECLILWEDEIRNDKSVIRHRISEFNDGNIHIDK